MINQEDYTMIADYDCMGVEERGVILEQKGDQVLIKPQIILLVTTMKYKKLFARVHKTRPQSCNRSLVQPVMMVITRIRGNKLSCSRITAIENRYLCFMENLLSYPLLYSTSAVI